MNNLENFPEENKNQNILNVYPSIVENPEHIAQILTKLEFFILREIIIANAPLSVNQIYYRILRLNYLKFNTQTQVVVQYATKFFEKNILSTNESELTFESLDNFDFDNYIYRGTSAIKDLEKFVSDKKISITRPNKIKTAITNLIYMGFLSSRQGNNQNRELYYLSLNLVELKKNFKKYLEDCEIKISVPKTIIIAKDIHNNPILKSSKNFNLQIPNFIYNPDD